MSQDPRLQLFEDYRELAIRIANAWRVPQSVRRDDLRSAALSGLWQATEKGPSETFEGYVRIKIRGAIRDELRRHDWVPRAVRRRLREDGIKADLVPLEDYEARYVVTAEQICEHRQELAKVFEAIHSLTPRQRYVLLEHHTKGRLFKEIADELGISEPRISQLHSAALHRLRQACILNLVPRDW